MNYERGREEKPHARYALVSRMQILLLAVVMSLIAIFVLLTKRLLRTTRERHTYTWIVHVLLPHKDIHIYIYSLNKFISIV